MVSKKHQETLTFSLLKFQPKKNLPDELYCCVDK